MLVDLLHLGTPRVIGAWIVGDVIVDPGPASCLPVLLDALADRPPPRALALTHIHLDHAGASGSLLRRFPDLEVWVHEHGAPHLVDPSRLVASARRLYGDDMARLWGEVVPVAAERVRALAGGERVGPFRVAYTPGHASHHVSYLHEDTGRAFTGDVTGVRVGGGYVLPPTPPPDVDLPAWRASLRLVEAWQPTSLAITHFDAYDDVARHLAAMHAHLDDVEAMARELDERDYATTVRTRVAEAADGDAAAAASYAQAVPLDQSYQGLARYLRGAATA